MMGILSLLAAGGFFYFLFWLSGRTFKGITGKASGVVLIGIFLLLSLSFGSYLASGGRMGANLGGLLGHSIADLMLRRWRALNGCALIVIGLASSIALLLDRYDRRLYYKLLGGFGALFWFSALIRVLHSGSWWTGSIANRLSWYLKPYLGTVGSSVLLVALALACLVLGFGTLRLPNIRLPRWKFGLGRSKPRSVPVSRRRSVVAGGPDVSVPEQEETGEPEREPRSRDILRNIRKRKPTVSATRDITTDALVPLLASPLEGSQVDDEECRRNARIIEEKLKEFGVEGQVIQYFPGPVVTRYEYEPAPGIKLSRIVNLADDLALRMKSNKIRIVAPLPEKGLIGIEVPNRKRRIVYFRELVENDGFRDLKSKLGFALGVDTAGHPVYANLARMPHLLIAGATGSGKSVCINTIITSILFKASPEEVRFLMIDPKRIELNTYEGIPHLLRPVVKDRKEACLALKQAVSWMDLRYKHFGKDGVRDIESHNQTLGKRKDVDPLPYIVIIIDEFADLILTVGKEAEEPLARLAQMARAVGIHLVVATQRPSVDVITGMIKANFPVRIAFKVPSKVDSRTILDAMGADKLLGLGDMLFIPPGTSDLMRLHGPFISEEETKRVSRKFIEAHLRARLAETFSESSPDETLAGRILDSGSLPCLTRTDDPGLEERFHVTVETVAESLGLDEDEVSARLEELRDNYYEDVPEVLEAPIEVGPVEPTDEDVLDGADPLLPDAARLIVSVKRASATLLQRKMKIGFARAARIIDQLEEMGIVGPQEGSKPRTVRVDFEEMDEKLRGLKA
jgi:S-DNA-T family DNA segregation ATPase FtsK/SpoIIIE